MRSDLSWEDLGVRDLLEFARCQHPQSNKRRHYRVLIIIKFIVCVLFKMHAKVRLLSFQLKRKIHHTKCNLNFTRPFSTTPEKDSICELSSSSIRYGPGSTSEVGQDLSFLKAKKVILFTDKTIQRLPCMQNVIHSLDKEKTIEYDIYSKVRVEPNDKSFQEAIAFMCDNGPYDAVVALGGGSVIDTAKAANLYSSHPPKGGFYDYVNAPLGKGLPPPGPILPFIGRL